MVSAWAWGERAEDRSRRGRNGMNPATWMAIAAFGTVEAEAGAGDSPARPAEGRAIAPGDEASAAIERAGEWESSLRPINVFEVFLVQQAAAHALSLERCQAHGRVLRTLAAKRASCRWDADRRLAAEELGARLAASPAIVARKLGRTRQGCEWLLERWEGLGRALEARGEWTEAEAARALDLLGTPADLRDGPNALDREGIADLASQRREVVRAEVARLLRMKAEGLDDLDAHERAAAELGFGPDDADLARVHRQERSCALRLQWAHGQLKKGRHDYRPDGSSPGRQTTTTPVPAPAAPRPSPPKTEAQYREEARALAARRRPRPETAPIPTPPQPPPEPATMPETAPILDESEPAAPDEALVRQVEAILRRETPADRRPGRLMALLAREGSVIDNRLARRVQAARARRLA